MLGMHGTYEANHAMHDCDLMICLGARFDDRVTGRIDRLLAGFEEDPPRHRRVADQQESCASILPIVADADQGAERDGAFLEDAEAQGRGRRR